MGYNNFRDRCPPLRRSHFFYSLTGEGFILGNLLEYIANIVEEPYDGLLVEDEFQFTHVFKPARFLENDLYLDIVERVSGAVRQILDTPIPD